MNTSSYQNSAPGELGGIDQKTWEPIDDYHENSPTSRKRNHLMLALGVAMVLFVALVGSSSPSTRGSLRAGNEVAMLQLQQKASFSSSSSSTAEVAQAEVTAADQPQPDYNGEGRYDWQKCKESNDPDCWKNEGDRVGSYWENFGQRMKTFWMNFRRTMHDFFVGKEATEDSEEGTDTAEKKTSKKKHKNKVKGDSAATAAASPEATETAAPAPETDSTPVSP